MKKIFEIPIYAFDEKELNKCIEKSRETFFKEYGYIEDKDSLEKAWKNHIYPQNNWDYNHLVGFIKIYKNHDDIFLDLFLADIKRYIWNTMKKKFVTNQFMNGMHFRMTGLTNVEISKTIDELLHDLIEHNIKRKNFYVDLDAYRNIKGMIDYQNI